MVSGFINSVAIISMIRILYGFFNPSIYSGVNYSLVLAIIGILTSFEGIFLILNQLTKKENDEINIDSILMYSAIVNVGLTLTSLSFQGLLYNELTTNNIYLENIAYSYLQMINLAATTVILFTCKERISKWREDTNDLRKLQGVGKELPITTLVFIIGLISNVGLLPTFGGIIKFMLLTSLLQTEYLILSILIIIVILMLLICYLWIIKFILFDKSQSGRIMTGSVGDDITLSTFSSLIIAIALIVFGLIPSLLANGIVTGIIQIFS
ncbi:MAG: proton-conducting transporter membrane subunit [Candidatus Thorarchaeota archaeon]